MAAEQLYAAVMVRGEKANPRDSWEKARIIEARSETFPSRSQAEALDYARTLAEASAAHDHFRGVLQVTILGPFSTTEEADVAVIAYAEEVAATPEEGA